MRVVCVVGTRPDIIKMAPLYLALKKTDHEPILLNRQQHKSKNMSTDFFNEFGISKSEIITKSIQEILEEKPDRILVYGDTRSATIAAIMARQKQVPVVHIEAGLRSKDLTMPEERNRILMDHLCQYWWAPTQNAKNNLIQEGLNEEKIIVTGNLIVDSYQIMKQKINPQGKDQILVTIHRKSNTTRSGLRKILHTLKEIHELTGLEMLFPIHPRTKHAIKGFKLEKASTFLRTTQPMSYVEFLQELASSKFCITDSGGVSEEACLCQVPTLIARENTERPEGLGVFYKLIKDINTDIKWAQDPKTKERINKTECPFGEPGVALRMIKALNE